VSDKKWPTETDLLRFVDQDLSPEQLERLDDHVRSCSACAKEVAALRTLAGDIAVPAAGPPLDVAAHVAGVMSRLDTPLTAQRPSRHRLFAGVLAAALAAAAAFALRKADDSSELAARGALGTPSLAREVGVELYAQGRALTALPSGSRLGARTAFTAGLRNSGTATVHLLLFAIDAQSTVHWIAPGYTTAGEDPTSYPIAPSLVERPLPTAATFDDLAPGPLRVVAIVTREARRVSEIEALPAVELAQERLARRFTDGDVREFVFLAIPQDPR
jgi:hypothetical protein